MNRPIDARYLDTCVLVSLFHGDDGYPAAETWLAEADGQELWISHWVLLEFASATAVRLRRGDLNATKAAAVQVGLEALRHERLAMVEPRGEDFLLARTWIVSDGIPGLRAADGLHLAMARRQGLRLVSADRALLRAACALGIPIEPLG
ncbi:MAG: type II toxin-antitoxin system VapC family toxin [Synechococcaceae cyanobacterium]|nr:type II toxin-antitoxin system VapC family toxin [Synechococcaceae cyanobacterium]